MFFNVLSIFTSILATVHFLLLNMQHLILFSGTMLIADLTLFSSIYEHFFFIQDLKKKNF